MFVKSHLQTGWPRTGVPGKLGAPKSTGRRENDGSASMVPEKRHAALTKRRTRKQDLKKERTIHPLLPDTQNHPSCDGDTPLRIWTSAGRNVSSRGVRDGEKLSIWQSAKKKKKHHRRIAGRRNVRGRSLESRKSVATKTPREAPEKEEGEEKSKTKRGGGKRGGREQGVLYCLRGWKTGRELSARGKAFEGGQPRRKCRAGSLRPGSRERSSPRASVARTPVASTERCRGKNRKRKGVRRAEDRGNGKPVRSTSASHSVGVGGCKEETRPPHRGPTFGQKRRRKELSRTTRPRRRKRFAVAWRGNPNP